MRNPWTAAVLTAAVLSAALTTPLAAQDHTQDPDEAVQGGGGAPAGWTIRADRGDPAGAKVEAMGKGTHLTLGPAIILYRADTRGSGPFHTLATFTQTKPSKHPEGYGLFAGGKGLEGSGQQYVYFLVRQDGSYLVKRRHGDQTSDVSDGWVKHAAVKQAKGDGAVTNLLEIDNKRDPSRVAFLVNGQEVFATAAKGLSLDGIVGIRANHNLDLHIEGFDVHR